MSNSLVAFLTLPTAINSMRNLIRALKARPSNDNDKQQIVRIEEKLADIMNSFSDLASFTEILRKWKLAHNITQQIIVENMAQTLAIFAGASSEELFHQRVKFSHDVISGEFHALLYQVPKSPTHGPTGAFRST